MPLINVNGRDYHASLTDRNGTVVGINLVNPRGQDDALAIQQANHPRTPLQTSQGQGEYSDLLLPYKELVQSDWSGGRASLNARKDQTRYLDGGCVDTEIEEQIILRGAPTYGTGLRAEQIESVPGSVSWQPLYGTGQYRSVAFTSVNGVSAANKQFEIWVRKVGTPNGTMYVDTFTDAAGDPNAAMVGSNLDVDQVEEGIAERWQFFSMVGAALAAATAYHFVVYASSALDDATNHWEIACVSGVGGKMKAVGGAWAAGPAPYYRVFSGANEKKGKFFIYKGAWYYIELSNSSNSRVFINGDRGAADSNAGNLFTLVDATKTWTVDEFAGAVVLITNGPGSDEKKPWRKIDSNTATTLVNLGEPWEIAHTTATEYVILGADVWKLHYTLTVPAKDVEVAGEYVFFTRRNSTTKDLYRRHERNAAGTWTISTGSDPYFDADFLKAIQTPASGMSLWGGLNNNMGGSNVVWEAEVPQLYSPSTYILSTRVGILDEIDSKWGDYYNTLVQEQYLDHLYLGVGAGHTTGMLALKKLNAPIDISRANLLKFAIRSSAAAAAGDFKLILYGDQPEEVVPTYLLHYNSEGYSTFYFYDASETDADQWKQQGNSERRRDGATTYLVNFTMAADDRLYIGYAQRFDRIKWNVNTAQTNVQAMSAKYWDGEGWAAVAGWSDGTASGGATLGQDGDMTFTLPTDWNPGTHGDQATYLDQSLYWIELTPAAALTVCDAELTLENEQVIEYTPLTRAKDGDTGTWEVITLTNDDYIYIGHGEQFTYIDVNVGTVPNAVASTLSIEYFNGTIWTSATIYSDGTASGGATLAKDGRIVLDINRALWSRSSIENNSGYWLRLKVNNDLTPYVRIVDVEVDNHNSAGYTQTLTIPAILADETTLVSLQLHATIVSNPLRTVGAIGLRLDTDLGAQTVELFGPMVLGSWGYTIPIGSEPITGLGSHGDERSNLMVHTVNNTFEIQSESDNAVVELPLDEIKAIRSIYNGWANTHNDVYHYYNLYKYVQRYVDGTLENIGPDTDEGLPAERFGLPSAMLSTPSRVLLAIDTTTIEDDFLLSTVMARRGSGWHEVYRSPYSYSESGDVNAGVDIYDLVYQSSYVGPDRIWISQGGDLLWVPIVNDNPLSHLDFTYTPSGYLITGWFDASFIDIEKTFTHLKIASENLTTGVTVTAQYQLDSGDLRDPTDDTHWTDISDVFDTSPSQRIELQTGSDVTARRIRFRLILDTNSQAVTPVVKSTNLQLIFYHPIKEVYNLNYRSNDVGVSVDGQTVQDNTALVFDAVIKGWATPPANVLTFNCMHPSFDGKTVVVQYPGGKPFESDPSGGPEAESLIRDLVLMEV